MTAIDKGKKRNIDDMTTVPGGHPPWVQKMEDYLSLGVTGKLWEDAIVMEWKNGFGRGTKSLPTFRRPEVIAAWVKAGRDPLLPPILVWDQNSAKYPELLQKYIDSVLVWWNVLQPEWRRLGDSDDLKEVVWKKKVDGDWRTLNCPGPNGFWSVLALLKWWIMLEQKAKMEDGFKDVTVESAPDLWVKLLKDVIWVMNQLADEAMEPELKKRRLEVKEPSKPVASSSKPKSSGPSSSSVSPSISTRVLRSKPNSTPK
jgi:hypothetical protein